MAETQLASGFGELNERLRVGPGGTLHVELDRGSVEIESQREDLLEIDARASGTGAGSTRFALALDGDDLVLEGRDEGGLLGFLGLRRVQVWARIPPDWSVTVATRGGRVTLTAIGGRVAARTSGGHIELLSAGGPVELRTSGSSVRAEDVRGDVSVRNSGGSIELVDIDGDVEARTSGGHIELDGVGGRVEARTSGGHITAHLDADPWGTLKTSGGHIHLSIPGDAALDLDARTSGGRVEVESGIPIDGRVGRHHAEGRINGGGGQLKLRTSGGHIRVMEDLG